MKPNIKVVPIDSGLSKELAIAVEDFIAVNQLGVQVMDKAWAVYLSDGETFRVLGFAGCNIGNRIADIPIYHVSEGKTRDEQWAAGKAHEMLFARVTGFIADTVGSGTQAFFYISPESQEHWKTFEARVSGRNAHRFVMEV